MIFAPPRTGKTEISSQLLPAFLLGLMSKGTTEYEAPPFEILAGGYSEDLTAQSSAKIITYMESDIYKAIFPQIRIAPTGGKWGDAIFTIKIQL